MSDQKVVYKLFYPAPFPGRGEHIRLLLEEAGAHYIEGTSEELKALTSDDNIGGDANTALYAPPLLSAGSFILSQTPNILQFLGKQLGLVGDPEADPYAVYRLNGLALTALDGFSNEIHSCHHPVGGSVYYEDQKEESLRRSKDYVATRIPAFLGYFERVLRGKASGQGPWLYQGQLTYPDLVLYQVGKAHSFEPFRVFFLASFSGEESIKI